MEEDIIIINTKNEEGNIMMIKNIQKKIEKKREKKKEIKKSKTKKNRYAKKENKTEK